MARNYRTIVVEINRVILKIAFLINVYFDKNVESLVSRDASKRLETTVYQIKRRTDVWAPEKLPRCEPRASRYFSRCYYDARGTRVY